MRYKIQIKKFPLSHYLLYRYPKKIFYVIFHHFKTKILCFSVKLFWLAHPFCFHGQRPDGFSRKARMDKSRMVQILNRKHSYIQRNLRINLDFNSPPIINLNVTRPKILLVSFNSRTWLISGLHVLTTYIVYGKILGKHMDHIAHQFFLWNANLSILGDLTRA